MAVATSPNMVRGQNPSLLRLYDSSMMILPEKPSDNFASDLKSTEKIVDTNITIPILDFSGIPLKDALTALTRAYQLSFYLDTSITGIITLRLENVSLNDALHFIFGEYDLRWERTGGIVKIFRPSPPSPPPPPIDLKYSNGLLSLNVIDVDLKRLIDTLIMATGNNIMIEDNVQGSITGHLVDLEFEKVLQALLVSNGFSFGKFENIYKVGATLARNDNKKSFSRRSIRCSGDSVYVDAKNMAIIDILNALTEECRINIIIYGQIEGSVSINYAGNSTEDLLGLILRGTPYSYKNDNNTFFVGDKTSENLYSSKLIKLAHLSNNIVTELIPPVLTKQTTVRAIKEHNGLILTGPTTSIREVEAFLREIDTPPAQVLFDAIVVDFNVTDTKEFNLIANNTGLKTTLPNHNYYPNIDYSATGDRLTVHLDNIADYLNIKNIGHLSSDFYARLKIMEERGIANIRSRPQIAALNGYSASIKIGTSQYYLLESKTIHPSEQTNVSTQTTQRFEVIEANMSLEVTPWVTESGEIIVEIKPEFNSPATAFDPDIPPTINRRILKSTVRLRNGETIILGGMIQNHDNIIISKFPVLGDIPILGRIFQNRRSSKTKSELMVYLTPHVYYGAEGSINIEKALKDKK
jgi:type IV pilus assembly protein PilQ